MYIKNNYNNKNYIDNDNDDDDSAQLTSLA